MKKLVVSVLGMLFAACGSNGSGVEDLVSKATSAIRDMRDQDSAAVDACRTAVDGCADLSSDAAAPAEVDVCGKLNEHCDSMRQELDDVREHAESCWEGVKACDRSAGEDCEAEAEVCDDFDNDRDNNRGPVIECGKIVEDCLAAVAAGTETVETCDAIEAACDEVGDLAKDAEDARAHGDDDADEKCRHAHDAIPDDEDGDGEHNGEIEGTDHEGGFGPNGDVEGTDHEGGFGPNGDADNSDGEVDVDMETDQAEIQG